MTGALTLYHRLTRFSCRGIFAARRYDPLFSVSVWNQTHQNTDEIPATDIIEQQIEQVLDTYGNSILRLAYSYLHNMNDAEDILQDTLMQYLKIKPSFHTSAHQKSWLLTVASNLSKNRIKYNAIRSTDELDESLTAESREDLSFVWEAVKSLPCNYQAAIHLFYYEGYSTAEISHILNRKESTIRSDLRRGRELLKKTLKEGYDFE